MTWNKVEYWFECTEKNCHWYSEHSTSAREHEAETGHVTYKDYA